MLRISAAISALSTPTVRSVQPYLLSLHQLYVQCSHTALPTPTVRSVQPYLLSLHQLYVQCSHICSPYTSCTLSAAISALPTPTVRHGLHKNNSMLLQYDPPLTSIKVRNVKKKKQKRRLPQKVPYILHVSILKGFR